MMPTSTFLDFLFRKGSAFPLFILSVSGDQTVPRLSSSSVRMLEHMDLVSSILLTK